MTGRLLEVDIYIISTICSALSQYLRDIFWDDNKGNPLLIKHDNITYSYNPQMDLLVLQNCGNAIVYPCIIGETKSDNSDRCVFRSTVSILLAPLFILPVLTTVFQIQVSSDK